MTGVTTGLRARKKASTSAAIESAALVLFARDGFAETSVRDIADAARVAPRTFFRHFASKDDVILAGNRARLDLLVELVAAEPADRSLFDAARAAMLALAIDYERSRDALLARAAVFARNPDLRARGLAAQQTWEDTLASALLRRPSTSSPPSTLEVRLVSGLAIAALRAAVDEWLAQHGDPDLGALVAEAFALFTTLERQDAAIGGLA